ncbi:MULTISPECIES: DUF6053 domain-containing protein [Bacteria]
MQEAFQITVSRKKGIGPEGPPTRSPATMPHAAARD